MGDPTVGDAPTRPASAALSESASALPGAIDSDDGEGEGEGDGDKEEQEEENDEEKEGRCSDFCLLL